MSCSRITPLLHLYVDGRLASSQFTTVEEHLSTCTSCRHDLQLLTAIADSLAADAAVEEPPQLTERILFRVADYEARRAVTPRASLQRREVAIRAGIVALLALVAFALLRPGDWANLVRSVERSLPMVVATLTSPGPNSISWGVWMLGAAVVAVAVLRIWRTDASAAWRRELANRLPQLW